MDDPDRIPEATPLGRATGISAVVEPLGGLRIADSARECHAGAVGAFNRLLVEESCRACGRTVERAYQFKYGDKWQLDYRLGDALRWGGNDEGTPGASHIETDCTPEPCPACGWDDDADYTLTIEHDVLIGVRGPTVAYE